MRWGFQVVPHALIVRMFGVVDQGLGEMFEQATERVINLYKHQVVIDFSNIESINAVGLVLCAYGLHHFRQLSIPVALVRPPASLLSTLKEDGLSEVFPIFLDFQSVPHLN